MKYLIVGRTGRGKDYLKELLQNMFDWKFVLSTTTRKPRFEGEDTHVFVTKEEATSIPLEDKVAITFIKNEGDEPDEYFATRQQVNEADGYIIDPKGVEVLLRNMPEEEFTIIYVTADNEKAREMAIERAKGKTDADKTYDKRYNDENEQFTAFEKAIKDGSFKKNNCVMAITVINDYTSDKMKQSAYELDKYKRLCTNVESILPDLKKNGTLSANENGEIRIFLADGTELYVTDKRFVAILVSDNEALATCMREWLSLKDTVITKHVSKNDAGNITLKNYIQDAAMPFISEDKLESTVNKIAKELINDDEFTEMIDNYVLPIIKAHQ